MPNNTATPTNNDYVAMLRELTDLHAVGELTGDQADRLQHLNAINDALYDAGSSVAEMADSQRERELTQAGIELDTEMTQKIGIDNGRGWIMLKHRIGLRGEAVGIDTELGILATASHEGKPISVELHGGFATLAGATQAARELGKAFDDYTEIKVVRIVTQSVAVIRV